MPKPPRHPGLVRASDTAILRQIAADLAITPGQQKLLNAAEAIQGDPDPELAFLARKLVLLTLPHTNPGDVPAWTRKYGSVALVIQPGWDAQKDRSTGVPYGTLPRLLLYWLTTEVLRVIPDGFNAESPAPPHLRTIQLGRSLSAFMVHLGLNPRNGSGKRSDAYRLHEQMRRLFSARIWFQLLTGSPSQVSRGNQNVSEDHDLWWDTKKPQQDTLWSNWVMLSDGFFRTLATAPVPVDMRALKALKRSPLALDLYALCSYFTFLARKSGESHFISWASLARHLGSDYTDVKAFKRWALKALKRVQVAYQDLRVVQNAGGFTILPTGRPAITAKPQRIVR